MAVIANKWVQKELKKAKPKTTSAFESVKHHTHAARATMRKTLRGVRK